MVQETGRKASQSHAFVKSSLSFVIHRLGVCRVVRFASFASLLDLL